MSRLAVSAAPSVPGGFSRRRSAIYPPGERADEPVGASCPDCEGFEGCSGCDGRGRVYGPSIFELLLQLRTIGQGQSVDKHTAGMTADALLERIGTSRREVMRGVVWWLRVGLVPPLRVLLYVEDQLRGADGRRLRAVAAVNVEAIVYHAEFSEDGVVTISELAPMESILLDRGRMSRSGYLVQVGGSPRLGQEVYAAIETALQRWLS